LFVLKINLIFVFLLEYVTIQFICRIKEKMFFKTEENMKMRNYLTGLLMLLFFTTITFAKNDSDSAKCEDDDFFWEEIDMDLGHSFNHMVEINHPTIQLEYGISGNPSLYKDKFSGNFADVKSGTLKLGFTQYKGTGKASYAIKYSSSYFELSKITTNWVNKADIKPGYFETDALRFGFGSSKGRGYKLGENANIVLYNTHELNWTKIDFKDTLANQSGTNVVDTYKDAFRVGELYQSGIKVKLYSPLSLDAKYERSIVFPRCMFWYWAGGSIVTGIGEGIIDYFSNQVAKVSPAAGPIVDFALHSAYNYGIYELRKKYMNWPIKTASPIMYEQFKVGLTFEF